MKKPIQTSTHIALFDTDKTLIEITPLVNRALDDTLQEHFDFHGTLSDLTPDEYAGQHMSRIISRLVSKKTPFENWYIEEKIEDAMRTYVQKLNGYLSSHVQPARLLCPGVIEFLHNLKKHNIPCAVFSGGISAVHKKALEVTGLDEYFDTTCTSDRSGAVDRVQLINFCVKDLRIGGRHVPVDNIVVFGDSPNDIRSAKKYRARSVAIAAKSMYTLQELEAEKPFKVYQSFKDYKRILGEVFGIGMK